MTVIIASPATSGQSPSAMTQPVNIVSIDQKDPMTELSRSPERNTFQRDNYLRRKMEEGNLPDPEYVKMYENINFDKLSREEDPNWKKDNLEYDLRSTDWILAKVRESRIYAQNLYAAICNNEFQKLDVMPILKDQRWGASWRYAGGIIADMLEKGDYIDWYCSGIRNGDELLPGEWETLTLEQQTYFKEGLSFVSESVVTDEIRADLKRLGWIVMDSND
jgi:hypothetical protein